jgi:hypothetical protein
MLLWKELEEERSAPAVEEERSWTAGGWPQEAARGEGRNADGDGIVLEGMEEQRAYGREDAKGPSAAGAQC